MRYIAIDTLRAGMVLALPLYGTSFGILLGEGMTLNNYHIQRINEMGYGGVYIDDELSKDIQVRHILGERMRLESVKGACELLRQAEQKNKVKISRARQEQLIMPVIEGLIRCPVKLIDSMDTKPSNHYIYYHAANVMVLSLLVGLELGLSGMQLYDLALSAVLHDVGNLFLPQAILNKPDRLTEQEFNIIKQHSQMGFDFLRENYDISIEACLGALQHHENYDGTGYPSRLKKDRISIYGRIIALTDVYDAMTSRRPYRKPMLPHQALAELERNAGTMFDPEIIRAFSKIVAPYPAGTCMELSSGTRCIVLENCRENPARPRVRTLQNISGAPLTVDLLRDPEFALIEVEQVLSV